MAVQDEIREQERERWERSWREEYVRTRLGGFAMPGSVEWTRRQNMRAGNLAFLEPGDAARLAGYMADRWEHVEQLAHERRMTPRQIQAEQARGPAMNAVARFRERQQSQTQADEQKPAAVEPQPAEPHEAVRKDPAHEHEIDELDMTHPDSPHNPENYRAPQSKVVEHRLEMGRRGERRQERIEQIRSAPGRMVAAVRERLTQVQVRGASTRMMEASRERLGQVGQRLGINRPEPAAAEVVGRQCDGMEQLWRAEYAQRTAPIAHGVVDRLRRLAPGAMRHEMQRRQAVMRGDLSRLGRQDHEGLQSFLSQKWGGMEALARDQKQIYRQMAEQGRSVAGSASAERENHWAGMEKEAQQRQEQFRAPPEVEKPSQAHKQEPKRPEREDQQQKQPATPQRNRQQIEKMVQFGERQAEKAQAREAARANRIERETQEKERARGQQPERAHERSR